MGVCFSSGSFVLDLDPSRNPWEDMHFLATAVHGAKSCGLDEVHFGMPGCLFNIGALTIRIGLWGFLYYDYNKEPPK